MLVQINLTAFHSFRYLASGCSLTDLQYTFRCGTSTAKGIVQDVCEKILQHLHDLCYPEILTREWLSIADGFESQTDFPNCIGAIDGKYVRLVNPKGGGSTDCVLLAVCDANYRFLFIDVGSYDYESDSSIYENNIVFRKMQENTLNIPNDRPVAVGGEPLPFVLVGDEAFRLSPHVLRPYAGRDKDLPQMKRIFNYRLSRARRCIECAFGILTNKWHIFHKPLSVMNAETIIRACCILHNFVRERDGVDFENTLNVIGLEKGYSVVKQGAPRSALATRENFAKYFSSEEGSVPWQARMIEDKSIPTSEI